MRLVIRALGAFCAAAMLMSCGGGGGATTNVTPTPSENSNFSALQYQGAFIDSCQLLDSATNLTTGEPLYYQFYQEVTASSGAVGRYTWRLHLYSTPDCSGGVVGVVQNLSAVNQFSIVGQANIAGKLVDQVVVKIGGATGTSISSVLGVSGGQLILEGAFRLSLPADVLYGGELTDLFLLESNKLYYGNEEYDANGFPNSIDASSFAVKLPSLLPMPPAPCAAGGVGWQNGTHLFCAGSVRPATSGQIIEVINNNAGTSGSAKYRCENGAWSIPMESSCASIFISCPIETKTWTVSGQTCSGSIFPEASRAPGDYAIAYSVSPQGSARFFCTNQGNWIIDTGPFSVYNSCTPSTPTSSVIEPLQLATAKNCMLCHGVDAAVMSSGTPLAPAFKTVAERYRNAPPAVGLLEGRIKNGVSGVYSPTPMPANPQVNDADLAILIPWILAH